MIMVRKADLKYARVSKRGRWHIVATIRPHRTVIAKCGRAITVKARGAESASVVLTADAICGLCTATLR